MARGKPVELATQGFLNQAEAIDFFKAMLARYALGERVSGDDHLHLAALLERHPEYRTKIGPGVDYFTTMTSDHGSKCFRVERTDGSGTHFSYINSVTGRLPTRKQEVSKACRWAVRQDLFRARDQFFATHGDSAGLVTCAVTGERIGRDDAHMDHRPPMTFEVIVTTFLVARGLAVEDVPITDPRAEQSATEITDTALRDDFRNYHRQVARLDLVKATVNLKQAGMNRLKPCRVVL